MSSDIAKGKPSDRLYTIIALTIGIIAFLGLFGQFIMVKKAPPPRTDVYVDEISQLYYAPPYILGKKYPPDFDLAIVDRLKRMTISEAQQKNYKPDKTCEEMNYFLEQITLNQKILVSVGYLQEKPSRWNVDGSWNW